MHSAETWQMPPLPSDEVIIIREVLRMSHATRYDVTRRPLPLCTFPPQIHDINQIMKNNIRQTQIGGHAAVHGATFPQDPRGHEEKD